MRKCWMHRGAHKVEEAVGARQQEQQKERGMKEQENCFRSTVI